MMANRNRDAAISFLKMTSSGNVREAYSKFVGPNFKHHNPFFDGSAETLMAALEENARDNPGKTLDVKRAIAEGDLMAVHSHVRFEEGHIVELWDLGQEVPEQSPNQHGMF
jgi:predicted SnoaL-like aldol condensation-catalyzing enzyme